jgi:hypothetical protein
MQDMAEPLVFVICTEPAIEAQSRLLVRSIRRFGGCYAQAPILSYAPRPGLDVSAECRRELEGLGVVMVPDRVNRQWPNYPFANKPLAAAHAEKLSDSDTLVFLDSDKVVLDEPTKLGLPPDGEIAVRAAFHRNIGLIDGEGPQAPFWNELYRSLGCRPRRTIRTTCDLKVVSEYFNSGMVAVRRERGLFEAWRHAFEIAMAAPPASKDDAYYVEQAALAAMVTWKVRRPYILPARYNLPVHWPCLQRERVIGNLPNAVSFHYADAFQKGGWRRVLALFRGKLPADRAAWLTENLTDLGF